MVIGIIIAAGIAVGAAFGLFSIGEGMKKRQEAIGEGIAKSITWLTIIVGGVLILSILLFFMTRSKATVGPAGKLATIQGGGAPVVH